MNPAEFVYGQDGYDDAGYLADDVDPIPEAPVDADSVIAPIADDGSLAISDDETDSHDSAPPESSLPDVAAIADEVETDGVFSEDAESLALVPETASRGGTSGGFTTDVAADTALYEQISYLYYRGIVQGDSRHYVATKPSLSRRDAFTLLFRVFAVSGNASARHDFSDISRTDPIANSLSLAVERGYVSPNKTFRPNDTITRAEFVKLLVVFSGTPVVASARADFADVPPSSPFAPYVHTFSRLLGGISGKSFSPDKPITRGDSFKLLHAYLNRA